MHQDAAEAHLSGDVGPQISSGVVRYRIWPARRHRWRAILAVVATFGVSAATWYAFDNGLWATIVFVGALSTAALFFFPTEVTLDGSTLHMRALGTPRTWDLRRFRRMEVGGQPLPRVELVGRGRLQRLKGEGSVTLPLPEDEGYAERVVVHLRKWVARQHTGRFEIDADHAPEDNVDA